MKQLIFQNNNVSIEYSATDKDITCYDREDMNNLPAGYSTKKRGVSKAVQAIKNMQPNESLDFHGVISLLDSYNLSMHTWCRMD